MDRWELKYKRYFLCGISLHLAGIQRIIETVVDIICENSYTGVFGDGKIFIIPIDEAIRIRTREKGTIAI